eukprot:7390816-Prymnesium_polylepis.2
MRAAALALARRRALVSHGGRAEGNRVDLDRRRQVAPRRAHPPPRRERASARAARRARARQRRRD